MQWPKESFISFRTYLINLYSIDESRTIVDDIGFEKSKIAFDKKSLVNWHNILKYAEARGKLDEVLLYALKEEPESEVLQNIKNGTPIQHIEGQEVQDWSGPSSRMKLEKIIGGRSTLVDISYLERGMKCSTSVAIIKLPGSSGSGFLTSGNILITNNHVLPDIETAEKAIVQFNYQKTIEGRDAIPMGYKLKSETLKTSKIHDWTAVEVEGNPEAKWGVLTLSTASPKKGDYVNIIQHPGGNAKKISLSSNVIAFCNDDIVHYLTDTLPGSSGSPVFDADWNVVALHHSGGFIDEPNVKGKSTYYRNEGIHINRVVEGIG